MQTLSLPACFKQLTGRPDKGHALWNQSPRNAKASDSKRNLRLDYRVGCLVPAKRLLPADQCQKKSIHFPFRLERLYVRPMTIRTLLRGRLVKQYGLALDLALQRVAHGASDVRMASLQWKIRPLVMIECRRRPSLHDVAVRAFGDFVFGLKLAAMGICMARFAVLRRSLELNVMRALNRLVAFVAGGGAMSANQRVICL